MPHDWFYSAEGTKYGPVSGQYLKQLADSGKLDAQDIVWREGLESWVKAGTLKDLFPVALKGPPPLPSDSYRSPDIPGLSSKARIWFSLLFFFIPYACVLISSILYYRWRKEEPEKARQINILGFVIFGLQLLVYFALAMLVPSQPEIPA